MKVFSRVFAGVINRTGTIWKVLQAPSFYPEKNRKSILRRIFAVVVMATKGRVDYFNAFGMDCIDFPRKKSREYVFEHDFWRKIIAKNYRKNINHSVVLRDKCLFWTFFSAYGCSTPNVIAHSKHGHYFVGYREVSAEAFILYLKSQSGDIFVKNDSACSGEGVYKLKISGGRILWRGKEFDLSVLQFQSADFIVQRCVKNHPLLDKVYPNSLNTARLITVWDDKTNKPELLTQFFRVGANGNDVDNWAVGGLIFSLSRHGEIGEFGYYKKDYFGGQKTAVHPETGYEFRGTILPGYEDGLGLVLKMHSLLPMVKSIGWDVAFTPDGPVIIEGNDDWEIAPAQIVNGGLRAQCEKYGLL